MIRPAKQLLLMMEVSGVTISDNLGIYGSLNFNSFLSLKCLVIARYQETGGVRDTRYLNLNLLPPPYGLCSIFKNMMELLYACRLISRCYSTEFAC